MILNFDNIYHNLEFVCPYKQWQCCANTHRSVFIIVKKSKKYSFLAILVLYCDMFIKINLLKNADSTSLVFNHYRRMMNFILMHRDTVLTLHEVMNEKCFCCYRKMYETSVCLTNTASNLLYLQ